MPTEILEAFAALEARHSTDTFSPAELVAEVLGRGSEHPESTIRTHIVSVMCVNVRANHAVRYDDPELERVGRGQYRRGAAVITGTGVIEDQASRGPRARIPAQHRSTCRRGFRRNGCALTRVAGALADPVEGVHDSRLGVASRKAVGGEARLYPCSAMHRSQSAWSGMPSQTHSGPEKASSAVLVEELVS